MKIKVIILLASLGFVLACKHDIPFQTQEYSPVIESITCSEDTVYFVEQVLPILQGCATTDCHDALTAEEDYIFDSYANILSTGAVEPGDPDDSEMFEAITDDDPDDVMPPSPLEPLTQANIDLIYTWIQQGALNNSCPDALCDSLEVTFSLDILPMVETFCYSCHTGIMPYGGVNIGNYDEIVAVASESDFLDIIDGNVAEPMPENTDGLSDCQVRMFEIWIENGMPND